MKSDRPIVAIVFSKDRAMQLDACLRSFAEQCKDIELCQQRVIYTSSHERSERQYEALRESHDGVEFIKEASFRTDLIQAIQGFSRVLFLVDDNLFVREWSLSEVLHALELNQQALGFSLRLGRNTTFSYPLNQAQKLPAFLEVIPNIMKFDWTTAEYDFGYPLEVSSSIYNVDTILKLVDSGSTIANPNSLEAFLDGNKDPFRYTQPNLLCFSTSVAFCNPVNMVQADSFNRSRDNFNDSAHALMQKFDLGYRIDLRPFRDFVANGCHQEVDMSFLIPPTEWTALSATVELTASRGESSGESEVLTMHKDITATSRLILSDLSENDRDRVREFVNCLKVKGSGSDWLLGALRRSDDLRRDEAIHARSVMAGLKERLAGMSRLKKEWYEPELSRLDGERLRLNAEILRLNQRVAEYEPELAHLRAEMGRIEHRLVRKLRQVLKNRSPWMFYATRSLVQRGLSLWGRHRKILETIRGIANTRVVSNLPWPLEQPLVSVVIASFNYGKYLHETIDSILAQTFQDFEIIVIDDGSTDPYTREVLAKLDKPKTRVLIKENQGLPKTRNNGIRMARGKYICCLDSDDCLKPTYLEKCVFQLETRNLDVCFSWVQTFGETNSIWETGPFLIDVLMKGNSVCVSAVFKKSLWELVGGYKEAMTHGYDDWEFWLTLAEHGAIGHFIPEPLMLHRKHPTSMSAGRKHRYDTIVEDMKSLHPKLFNEPFRVKKIRKQQRRTFAVTHPLCNLVRPANRGVCLTERQIRILLATPWFDLSGVSVIKKDVFTRLAKQGVKVTAVAATVPSGAYTENGLPLYETITDECFNLPRFLAEQNRVPFVKYLIQSRGIRLLYMAGSRPIYEMLPELKKSFPNLRVIDELYNVVGHLDSNREFSKFIDLNIVVNEEIRERLIVLGESPERIRVITPGIDGDHFCPENPIYREGAARRPYQQFTFGYLGRLSPEKRPEDFVRLAGQLPSCQFRIAGDGPLTSRLAEEISTQHLSDRCHLEGSTNNTLGFLAGIDALVIPSEVEGLPLVLLEAMALQLPVIATNVGGIPRVVVHGRNGLSYKPGHVDELVSLATMLSQLPMRDRRSMGRRARETVLLEHSISTCAAQYLAAFRTVVRSYQGEDLVA